MEAKQSPLQLNNLDSVIETLEKNSDCSKYMLDWIVSRIYDLRYGKNDWKLINIGHGYNLSSSTYCFDYYYVDFV